MLLENFELNSGSIPKDMRVLMRKDLQQLSCFDNCWSWSVFAESTVVFVSQNLLKLYYKQLCRDMELTLMNVPAEQAFSLTELHEHLNSSNFPGSFGTIESPTLVSAILNDGVVGCGGGSGEAEHVPQQFGRILGQVWRVRADLHVALRDVWAAWQCRDLVDLDVNEAGMRLTSRITSWSAAGEKLKYQGSEAGVERPARQALTPRIGAYAQVVLWGGMVASAQRLLCSTGPDEWDARGRLCQTHQSKAKVVAVGELVTKRSFAMVHGPSRSSRSRPLF